MSTSKSSLGSFRTAFFSGLLLLAPLVVTIWAFGKIIEVVGGSISPLFIRLLPDALQRLPFVWELVGTFFVILSVTLLGYLSRYVFGKYFWEIGERAILSIPGVGQVYSTVKQIVDTFGPKNRNLFSKVVLVPFPTTGSWVIGFLTTKEQAEAQQRTGTETWTVFIPTTPNPTSGFLVLFPKEKVVELDMSVGEGMKMIISGGAVAPEWTPTSVAEISPAR